MQKGTSSQHKTLRVRTAVKAGGYDIKANVKNHNESFRLQPKPAIAMRREVRKRSQDGDRLELLVVRAGLRAGWGRRGRQAPGRARGRGPVGGW